MTAPHLDIESDTTLSKTDALQLLERQAAVLEMIADGEALHPTLADIVVALEDFMPGARCSVLLFNPASGTLDHGAAPHLPDRYNAAINGMAIGPKAGSCGTAAYSGVPVIAYDISSDERWTTFREFALPHGLRSCWSTPIKGRGGITGTFAVYHDAPHSPTARDQLLVERFTHLASVAIDHARLFGALTQSEAHFRHAFQDNAVGMALVNLDGGIVKVNRALREFLRRPESELLAMRIDQIIKPDTAHHSGESCLADLMNGTHERIHFDATVHTSSGRQLQVSVDAAIIHAADGAPEVFGVNLLDITDRRAAEAERRARREAEVARRIAESASRNKSDFVAAMSHDLRTPLQSIAGFTEMLREMDLPPERRQTALAHVASATEHITDLVNDVLDIARIEAGSLPMRMADVALDTAVQEVLDIAAPMADVRSVAINTNSPAFTVVADARRLRQVLLNLVSNAIVYNRPFGTVDITVTSDHDLVVIQITNTGDGIPADRLDRLFVPFDRLGAEESGLPGVGLGLTLALGLTEAMGGTLGVDSHPGADTTVTMTLLRAEHERH